MADDIIEMKPGFGGFKVNLRALLRKLGSSDAPSPVAIVAERFLTLFEAHGVAPTEIQHFFPELTLDKLHSTEALLATLTDAFLNKIANLFAIRRAWLDGVDDVIYSTNYCYKAPERLFSTLATLQIRRHSFPVRALYAAKRLDARKDVPQPLALLCVEPLREIGDKEISRYTIFGDAWDWSEPILRIQLKAVTRVLQCQLGFNVPLYHVTEEQLDAVLEGRLIPRSLLSGCLLTEPSLEDFALSPDESRIAKEPEELSVVKDYIAKHNLESLTLGLSEVMKQKRTTSISQHTHADVSSRASG